VHRSRLQRNGIEQSKFVISADLPAGAKAQLLQAGVEKSSNKRFLDGVYPELVERARDDKKRNEKQPLYVVGFDVEKNQLIVGEDRNFKSDLIYN